METETAPKANVSSDVLHSNKHSTLSVEEIEKAVARHNRHHPGTKTAATSGKPQTGAKK